MARKTATPAVIRAALRGQVLDLLPDIVTIVLDDDQPAAARVRAFETIARYGLGVADMGQVTVEVRGDAHFGVVMMPSLEPRPVLAEGEPQDVEIVRELPDTLAEHMSPGQRALVGRLMSPPASGGEEHQGAPTGTKEPSTLADEG